MTESPQVYPTKPKRLVRTKDDKMIAGVCGGLARYLGIDANILRVAVVIGTILGLGSLILAYIVAWVLMPQEP